MSYTTDVKRQTLQHIGSKVAGKQVSASTILEREIAVRYSSVDPALMIKDENNKIIEFISSGAVHTAISEVNNVLDNKIYELSGVVSGISEEVADHENRLDTAESAITENTADIAELSSATKTGLEKASADTVAVETKVTNLSANTYAAIQTEVINRQDSEERITNGLSAFSASVVTKLENMSGGLEDKVDELSAATIAGLKTASADTVAVETKVTNLSANTYSAIAQEANARQTADEDLSGSVIAFSGEVVTELATLAKDADLKALSSATKTGLAKASADTVAVETKVTNLSANTYNAIAQEANVRETADEDIYKALSAVSGSIVTEIIANEGTTAAALNDLDGRVDILSGNVTDIYSKLSSSTDGLSELSAATEAFSAATVQALANEKTAREDADSAITTAFSAFSSNTIDYIKKELSVVYKVKGSVADVTTLAAKTGEVGDVWNVVASGTTPSTGFIEAGKTFEAGSNFVWVSKTDDNGYTTTGWDILGGTVDFTALNELSSATQAFSAQTVQELANEKTAREDADNAISGTVNAFSAKVVTELATFAKDTDLKALSSATKTGLEKASADTVAVETKVTNLSANTYAAIQTEVTNRQDSEKRITEGISAFSASVVTKLENMSDGLEDKVDELSAATIAGFKSASADTVAVETKVTNLSANTYSAIQAEKTALEDLSGSVKAFSAEVVTELATLAKDTDLKALSAATIAGLKTASADTVAVESKVTDLSAKTYSAIAEEANARETADEDLGKAISAVSGSIVTEIIANEKTVATALNNLNGRVDILSGNVTDIYSKLSSSTDGLEELSAATEAFSAATVAALSAEKTAREDADTAITASLSAVSAVSVTAVQNVVLDTVSDYSTADTMNNAAGTATGAYVEKTSDNTIKLDLTYLSIDCGEY